jgi:hypothetical protein
MFCSSMTVFIYITFGGVVGPDIRNSIRFKDLIFGAFLFILLITYYTYKIIFLQKEQTIYDAHIVHAIGNIQLLQYLTLNRTAMTYWGQKLRRWRNNRAPCLQGARVALPANPMGVGVTNPMGVRIPLVFTIELTPIRN